MEWKYCFPDFDSNDVDGYYLDEFVEPVCVEENINLMDCQECDIDFNDYSQANEEYRALQ